MTHILPWTDPMDARLTRLRREGEGWPEVSADLHLATTVVRARARCLGVAEWGPAEFRGASVRPEDPNRPPLPAGHVRTWRILTDGTLLAGTPSPVAKLLDV